MGKQKTLFSSGPTCKNPEWSLNLLKEALVGRSHRSLPAKVKLGSLIEKTRSLLAIPSDYRMAIMPGSATGAVETALWHLLGPRPVTAHVIDVFSHLWAKDVIEELKLSCIVISASNEEFLELKDEPDHDLLLTLNGTTSGMMYPDLEWIQEGRGGLVIADLTSAAFCMPIDWSKIDAAAFSWQKGLGSEAAHGMLVLSPRAVQRLHTYKPSWPLPRLFRLMGEGNTLNENLFKGLTLNTPSMLCVEDCLVALKWAQRLGGGEALLKRCDENFNVIRKYVEESPLLSFSITNRRFVSKISPCLIAHPLKHLKTDEQWSWYHHIAQKIEKEGRGYDFLNHAFGIPAFRVWCGPTVDAKDIDRFMNRLIREI